mmetsp:Transcript_3533/g.5802  ORF Transcript_3533/g.5802 Transcript_3533/m.5802 type:complete len:280 (-) Transcript_3533:132-971(-)
MVRLQASLFLCSLAAVVASPLCSFQHCVSEMWECLRDEKCRAVTTCQLGCAKMGKNFGGCAQMCHQDHPSSVSDSMTACLFDNHCMPVPFPMVDHCKTPKSSKPIGTKMMQGLWWTVRGYDKISDCQACNFRQWLPKPNSSFWSYGDNTGVVDINGNYNNFTYFNDVRPSETDSKDSLVYHWGLEAGMNMKEEWWLLDETEEYKQIYYCTTDLKIAPGKQLEGGLILSKTKDVPTSNAARIADIFKESAGLDYDAFCSNDNTCPVGPAKKTSESATMVI